MALDRHFDVAPVTHRFTDCVSHQVLQAIADGDIDTARTLVDGVKEPKEAEVLRKFFGKEPL